MPIIEAQDDRPSVPMLVAEAPLAAVPVSMSRKFNAHASTPNYPPGLVMTKPPQLRIVEYAPIVA